MSFSVTDIIYLSGRRLYGKRHVRRCDTRMGQERKGVPESPGGHRRQPARRRHSGRVHRLLPMVHVPAGMHRHRRRARHGMPGQRHGPVQGKLHPRRGAGIELPASLRHRLRQGRLLRHPERNVVESKDPVGGSLPLPAAPAKVPEPAERPGLPDTPSPRSSAPKTPQRPA